MEMTDNKRIETRLRYQWTVLFAKDSATALAKGMMVDVSSGGLAFRCDAGKNCPSVGQQLVTQFDIPNTEQDEYSETTTFTRSGRVLRVDTLNPFLRHIAIQFDEPLPIKPCEIRH